MEHAISSVPSTEGRRVLTRYLRRARPAVLVSLASVLWLMALLLGAPSARADGGAASAATTQRPQMANVWATVYSTTGVKVVNPAQAPPPPAPGPERWTHLADHLNAQLNAEYRFNAADFSGDPTVSCITDGGMPGPCNGPAPVDVQPQTYPYPPSFEGSDNKFYGYGSIGTTGYGDPRVNTYASGFFNDDLDGRTLGSPYFSYLDAFGGDKKQLVNAFAEMNGLTRTGMLSHASTRIGRVFIPYTFPGLAGSAAIDGGRFAYDDTRTSVSVFAGQWDPLYGSLNSETFIGGGSISRQLFPKAGPNAGLAPYIEYLHLSDSVNGNSSNRHIYGFRGWYRSLLVNGYFTWINENPIDLGMDATYAPGRFSFYGHILKKLTSNDYTYDVFYTADNLRGRQFLNLGAVQQWTDFVFDGSYQFYRWLNAGAGTWVRVLDNQQDTSAYSESFQEASCHFLITPRGPLSGSLQYRYRGVRRGGPSTTQFDDVSNAGETQYQEINPEVSYRMKDRLQVQLGGYWGQWNFQDRLLNVNDTTATGGYVRTRANLTEQLALRLMFLVDRGNDQFTPDINLQYVVRAALEFTY